MDYDNLKLDKDYYKKIPVILTLEEMKIMYSNVYKIKEFLELKKPSIKKEFMKENEKNNKRYVRMIKCPCCGREMTNRYFYIHRGTNKYIENMKSKEHIKK